MRLTRSWCCWAAAALAASAGACQSAAPIRDVEVVGADYAFTAPDTIPAGATAFAFRNAGSVRHELKLIALRPDIDLREAMRRAMIDSSWAEFREPTSGILTAEPGQTTPGRLLVTLRAGRTYLLLCAFAASDSAPLHSELGMVRALHVK